MEASKWLHVQALLEMDEIIQLFKVLGDFKMYRIGAVLESHETEMSRDDFLDCYKSYISTLKEGKIPQELDYRPAFTSVISVSPDMLEIMPLENSKQIIKVVKPVIQIQVHRLGYSQVEEKFRPMVKGKESITWGIQFAYPQLFQEFEEVYKVDESDLFPNTQLFHTLQKWIRQNTIPTPFLVDGKKINVPIRLGKNCFSWINHHAQLIEKNIKVSIS
jgi:hypothetical protein